VSVGGGGVPVGFHLATREELAELPVHVAPRLLGGGTPLFAGGESAQLELARTVPSETVTHLWYRVRR
jgi:hypothetical protein